MLRSQIIGIGRALPERILSNTDLEQMVDTSDQWITERTGIKERRILDESLSTSDLATAAARKACESAEIEPSDLDAIIVGTVTPDMQMPATAVYVQHKLGAGTCPAFDISAACAGFIYGLTIGDGLIRTGAYRRIAVIGVEILSRVLDWSDRNTCVLFGDGAGAAVLGVSDDPTRGVLAARIHSDGAQAPHLTIPGGGSVLGTSHATVDKKQHCVHMNGRQIFTQAVRNMSAATSALLADNGVTPDDVDLVFAHQANIRIIESVSQRTQLDMRKFFNNIGQFGNTSSASIPMAMSQAADAGMLRRGKLSLLTALGAGVSWGAALVRW